MAHAEEERKALGRDLAQARKDAGLSLDGAAAELTRRGFPIKKQAIGAWEVGRNVPDTLWLRRLARLYGTSTDALTGNATPADWPLSEELHTKVVALSGEELSRLENVMRAHLDMPRESLSVVTNERGNSAHRNLAHQYPEGQEEGAGLPESLTIPVPRRNDGSSPKDRRGAHAKRGGGA